MSWAFVFWHAILPNSIRRQSQNLKDFISGCLPLGVSGAFYEPAHAFGLPTPTLLSLGMHCFQTQRFEILYFWVRQACGQATWVSLLRLFGFCAQFAHLATSIAPCTSWYHRITAVCARSAGRVSDAAEVYFCLEHFI